MFSNPLLRYFLNHKCLHQEDLFTLLKQLYIYIDSFLSFHLMLFLAMFGGVSMIIMLIRVVAAWVKRHIVISSAFTFRLFSVDLRHYVGFLEKDSWILFTYLATWILMIDKCSTSALLLLLMMHIHGLSESARRKRVLEDLWLRIVSRVVFILIRISMCLLRRMHYSTVIPHSWHTMPNINLTEYLSWYYTIVDHCLEHLDDWSRILQKVLCLSSPAANCDGENTCVL